MVRLLTIGPFPETTSEEASHEKIAFQTIRREFSDADEANLLEEEDMHVFDSRPLTDPLHLVRCNACKKPIKASQYAAHAERCRSLNSMEDTALDLDDGTGHKKPPRKGMETLEGTNGNNRTTIDEQEKSESMDGNDVAGSGLNFNDQSGRLSSQSGGAQNAPVPLATKVYHSQGNHRLRLALGHLYHGASAKVHGHDSRSPELIQDKSTLSSQVPSLSKSLHGVHKDGVPQKFCNIFPNSAFNFDTSENVHSALTLKFIF